VKFLVDNQLPAALARFIESRGCEASHVLDLGLSQAPDSQIFRRADLDGYFLVSKARIFCTSFSLRALPLAWSGSASGTAGSNICWKCSNVLGHDSWNA
jgi:predicted nuclease of predicted toxin-antitoxin system